MPQAHTCPHNSGQVPQIFLHSHRQGEFSIIYLILYSSFLYSPVLDMIMSHTRKKKLERCVIKLKACH